MGVIYTLPFAGRNRITSSYGPRTLNGVRGVHHGFDIVGDDNTDVGAPCAGTVKSSAIVTDRADSTWEWGNFVKVQSAAGMNIFLCHMQSRAVQAGQSTNTGDKLGVMGNTGYSFGAHTHWEARTAAGTKINPGELLGLPDAAGVTWDREAMAAACVGYLDCTVPQYRWRTGAGTDFALYKPANTGACMYCRKGVTYRVYAVTALPGGEVWCQITPPAGCAAGGGAPALWVSAACGTYTAKAVPEVPAQAPVDWNSTGNDFLVTASKGDRPALREVCERLALPVKNM